MTESKGTHDNKGQGTERVSVDRLSDIELKYLLDTTQHRPQYQRAFRELIALRTAKPADGWQDVIAERRRQISTGGWTPEHDDQHGRFEMATAAGCYALYAAGRLSVQEVDGPDSYIIPSAWPWDPEWWKPSTQRRNLVKAGALILAEIDRLDRLPAAPQENSHEGK